MGGPNQALNKEDRNAISVTTFSHKRLSFKNCVGHAHELCTSVMTIAPSRETVKKSANKRQHRIRQKI